MGPIETLGYILKHPFNRGRPLATFLRYAGWQFVSRVAPGPIAVPFVDNVKLIASRGMTGATGNIYCGLHEFEDMGFALHLLRRDDLFVDVGANVGSYSLLAAATGANVIAFEPGEAFPLLKRNVEANSLSVDCRREAIGAHQGTLRFTTGMDTTNRAALEGEAFVDVPLTTLDAAIDRPPAIIKIDVEGLEDEAVAGGERIIRQAKAVIIEGGEPEKRHAQFAALGFHPIRYDPLTRKVSEPVTRGQSIFVREDVSQLLRNAPRYRVGNRML